MPRRRACTGLMPTEPVAHQAAHHVAYGRLVVDDQQAQASRLHLSCDWRCR